MSVSQRRRRLLQEQRTLKMASSAHAYVRGSTRHFYEWLEARGVRAVPEGPAVWICGDCHEGNLGPLAARDGKIHVQIRDLDQAVIGNPNHDLIRLALSLSSTARGSDLPGVTTAHMLEQMMVGYRRALKLPRLQNSIASDTPDSIKEAMRRAMKRTWKQMSRDSLRGTKPGLPRGDRFWSLTNTETQAIRGLFEQLDVRRVIASSRSRPPEARTRVVDAAYWVKGCSSLGKLRFAVLLDSGGGHSREDGLCLIDIKEAVSPSALRTRDARIPIDNGQRLVAGARHLSPALGDRMIATKLMGHSVVLREVMPQDLKLAIGDLSAQEAVSSARYLAEVVGKAHARQMDQATRREYSQAFKRRRADKIDAPSWLWSSVVELAAVHERAYLEHCRKYALAGRRR